MRKFINFLLRKRGIPKYYFDNTISDKEKLEKDWEMIGKGFENILN